MGTQSMDPNMDPDTWLSQENDLVPQGHRKGSIPTASLSGPCRHHCVGLTNIDTRLRLRQVGGVFPVSHPSQAVMVPHSSPLDLFLCPL